MKKKHKISTLVIGIIVAIMALSSSSSYAENSETNKLIELKSNEAEMLDIIKQILEEKDTIKVKKCSKIYNSKNQLIYECRDKNDDRLKLLLRRSDLVLQTDSSSYYLLGD